MLNRVLGVGTVVAVIFVSLKNCRSEKLRSGEITGVAGANTAKKAKKSLEKAHPKKEE